MDESINLSTHEAMLRGSFYIDHLSDDRTTLSRIDLKQQQQKQKNELEL